MLTVDISVLRSAVRYDPDSGALTWAADRLGSGRQRLAGDPVGSLDSKGYLFLTINGVRLFAHRAAWALYHGEWPALVIDHIDGNPLNNRISNLRVCTMRQNQGNRRKRKPGMSRFKGVDFDKRSNVWRARINFQGKRRHLGSFRNEHDAAAAYLKAAQEQWGAFAHSGVI